MSSGYEFTNRSELDTAVDLWISNQNSAITTYGEINTWDVSKITNFSALFYNARGFNSDIGDWDVSNGTNFSYMFEGAHSFNQDIGDWDVGKESTYGTYFIRMFSGASSFNQDIGDWDVSQVNASSGFDGMFRGAQSFTQKILATCSKLHMYLTRI